MTALTKKHYSGQHMAKGKGNGQLCVCVKVYSHINALCVHISVHFKWRSFCQCCDSLIDDGVGMRNKDGLLHGLICWALGLSGGFSEGKEQPEEHLERKLGERTVDSTVKIQL